ncbi:response regulator transcription factor [Streptomyces aidingensis]|uniref:Response regulatory domain-containing protein n=1 Tax=Streptomyces aidingensis TaxID=910347 RepID=A0A1I1GRH7_9ACTN|nr:response regulator transcription factor [Streptomyces aidingensis]SFC14254.1 hypothetical protein SAMN05421773_102109 [Streptomyces aidingensis]
MRVVVIDNVMPAGEAVARALDGTGHEAVWVPAPRLLDGLLRTGGFGLALVDLDFGREPVSGLTALRSLAGHGVPSVIYSADSEENRLLFLLAAFEFHSPVGLITKETTGAQIRELVTAVGRGDRPSGPLRGDRYRPPAHGPSWLDRLLPTSVDLAIWEQLPYYTNRNVLAQTAHVHVKTVDKFLARHWPHVEELHRTFGGPAFLHPPETAAGDAMLRQHRPSRLAQLHGFARTHLRFFRDAELRRLITSRTHRPRT